MSKYKDAYSAAYRAANQDWQTYEEGHDKAAKIIEQFVASETRKLRQALEDIKWEAARENGNWIHLKRCIYVQAKEALDE